MPLTGALRMTKRLECDIRIKTKAAMRLTTNMGTRMIKASIRCGTVQFHHRANDKADNMSVVERFAREAADQGVKILAFPEMCLSGYWHVRDLP